MIILIAAIIFAILIVIGIRFMLNKKNSETDTTSTKTSTHTTMAHEFDLNESTKLCKKCDLSRWQHPNITYTN